MKKAILATLVTVALLVSSLAGCVVKKPVTPTTKYTTGFSIEYLEEGCKKVTDGEGQELLLIPHGKAAPAGYEGLPQIEIPVERVICLSTTEVCLLRPLGELDSVIGVTTKKERWHIDEIKEGMEAGTIELVGTGMGPPNYEKISALKPDIVFMYTGSPRQVKQFEKFKEIGVPVAVDNEWLEWHPLGRLEWVKFLAAFYDKERVVNAYFSEVESRVKEIADEMAKEKEKPSVLWASIWRGKCYVPASDSYAAREIAMAGGDYLFPDLKGTGNANVTLEELFARGKDADILVYSSTPPYIKSIKEIIDKGPTLADIKPIKEGKVWCFQPWYWESVDKTDEIIEDMAVIFHPSLFPGYELKHFMKLPAE